MLRRVRRLLGFALLASAMPLAACSGGLGAHSPDAAQHVVPAPVSDEEFGRRLVDQLADKPAPEERRKLRLGLVRRQLLHAGARFAEGAAERGTTSVLGGLALLAEGDHAADAVDAETKVAIDGAIAKLSARGDIGRTRFLFALRRAVATPAELKEIDAHAAALERFQVETLTGHAMEKAGDAQRTATAQALVDHAALGAAVDRTSEFIDRAVEENVRYQQTNKRPTPEEAAEIIRALESGGLVVVALSLRWGSVEDAIVRVGQSSARLVLEPDFFAELNDAFRRDDAQSFRDLYDGFVDQAGGRAGSDVGLEQELYDAARLALLAHAYRRDPHDLPTAHELARLLSLLGMSEATPVLMEDALSPTSKPAEVARALRLVGETVERDAKLGDLPGAARTVGAAGPLLAKAKTLLGAAQVGGLADLRFQLAATLVKGGFVTQAEALLTTALEESPRAAGYLQRAQLARQRGALRDALADAAKARAAASDPLDSADARLVEFELFRELGQASEASAALGEGLKLAEGVVAEKSAPAPRRTRALRATGRARAAYGDRAGARKSFVKALEAAAGDRAQLGGALLDAMSAELVLGDVDAMRALMAQAVAAGAPQEDLVYAAVWLSLAAKQRGVPADEGAVELLEGASGLGTWIGQLAAWSLGKLDDAALTARATSAPARVEASFYVALARRAGGRQVDSELRDVAKSSIINLLEVRMARELLAPVASYGEPHAMKAL